ncbi:Translation initiation factor eIF-2B subunit alpha [Geodia barretti]|uniref:Translation initiation factor eIF2B subunit alpha n=3 Tax=Geodia barretti TaxID=519541 RepID=A0AA35SAX8_GEOBA|nr:Translation initiation factor eIF-2B subunit alpha [Geodia barretti]
MGEQGVAVRASVSSESQLTEQETDELVKEFEAALDQNLSEAVAAIQTLLKFIKTCKVGTISGLRAELKVATETLIKARTSTVSVSSGCELFLRFITMTSLEGQNDFEDLRRKLIKRGDMYLQKVADSRQKIAHIANPFIRDGTTILTHSRSRVVYCLLKEAMSSGKRIKVFVTASTIDNSGEEMHQLLQDAKVPSKVILDSAVGFIMEEVDLVIVGAEGVAESGGIINKIGTYQMAVMAKALNKPFYVVAESFKFVRMYPLNQGDLPNDEKYTSVNSSEDSHPYIDYSPPQYITLLFSDIGVLTPSAVSDELIKLYL